jgi:hypothetical protein
MTSSSEPRRPRARRLRRWLATTGIIAVAAMAIGTGTASASTLPYEDDAQVVSVSSGWSYPSWGGGYVTLKRSW